MDRAEEWQLVAPMAGGEDAPRAAMMGFCGCRKLKATTVALMLVANARDKGEW